MHFEPLGEAIFQNGDHLHQPEMQLDAHTLYSWLQYLRG